METSFIIPTEKFAFDDEIKHDLMEHLKNTVWGKVSKTEERATQLIQIHQKFIDNVRNVMSSGEISKRLYIYEKNLLRI